MFEKPTYEELEKRIQELEQAASDPRQSEERKKVKESLQESQYKLATHLQNTPIGALSWDLDFKIIEWNPAAENIFGFSKAEAIGRHATELILPGDMKELVDGVFRDLISEKGGSRSRNENRTKSGRRIICDWYNTPLKDIAGKIVGIASLVNDVTERSQTFEALKKQKEFNEKIVQTSNAIIIGLDNNHKIKIFNKGAEKITGFKAEEVIGKDWFKIFFEPNIYDEMNKVWETAWGAEYNSYVNPIRSKNGDEKIISWQATGIYDGPDVTTHMMISIGDDITKRIRAEETLRQSEERFRQIYEQQAVGVARVSLDFQIESVNKAYCSMIGYQEEDLIGKYLRDITHPEILEENLRKQSDLVSGKKDHYRSEKQFIHKNGDCIHGILDANLVRNSEGKPLYVLGSVVDITERKKIEQALQESEEKYRSMMEAMKEAAYICSSELCIKYMNSAMIDRVGRDATGETCHKAIYNRNEKCSWCVFDQIQKGEVCDYEVADSKDSRYYSVTNSPIYHSTDPASKLTIFHDITEMKISEENLRQSQKMEVIGTLTAGVAHDLNNILSGIVSYPELLLTGIPEDSHLRKPLLTIQKSGQKAAHIVQDLLTMARRGVLVTEVVNLNQVISDQLESPEMEELTSFHPCIQVIPKLDDTLLNVKGSPTHLSKSIMNLFSNAAEAMSKKGIITISTSNVYLDRVIKGYEKIAEGDYVKVTVSDDGMGIAPKDIEKIFEPFYTKKTMARSGTGLGMAVVWGTLKDHNGYIDIKSIEGAGTTIIIYIPVTREELKEKPAATSLDEYKGNGESILIVDDVEEQREVASAMLTKLGYSVFAVSSGEDALEYLKTNSPDLLVLDMIMEPGLDGLDTYKRVLEIQPFQRVIIASGYSRTGRVKELQQLGAGRYVKKPYTLMSIGFAVKEELRSDRSTLEESVD